MGSCIICGTSVDGFICRSHEEDVAFNFTGTDPESLTVGRFYAGTVDGIAEFGVFITIGEAVTGLLHRSELPMRLESLDWQQGDDVFAQVLGVHDNGNVDLGWSIRQSPSEFRGQLVQTPSGDQRPESEPKRGGKSATKSAPARPNGGDSITVSTRSAAPAPDRTEPAVPSIDQLDRVPIDALTDREGSHVVVEGRIIAVRQTSGPTIFKLSDESGVVSCAGFDGAGVRAFPDVDAGDVVRLLGDVERRRGELQIEIETIERLTEAEASTVLGRLDDVLTERSRPDQLEFPIDNPILTDLEDSIGDATTAIRRAIIDSRPIVLRHTATADGYVAGAAIERAVLALIRAEHDREDAEYRYFDRRPLDGDGYDMRAATEDVTKMLDDRERFDEKLPLVLLVDTGTTPDSADGSAFLDIYGVERVCINAGPLATGTGETTSVLVQSSAADVTTTALATAVAWNVEPAVRDDLRHLPAVSYWDEAPAEYRNLAEAAGYDAESVVELREAVALEAYYQAYEDKRELITDLLFTRDEDVRGLASHISEQFRVKLEAELDTVRPHLDRYDVGGNRIVLLDLDAFTHRYDFPPKSLLVEVLHRSLREDVDRTDVTVGLDADRAHIRTDTDLDLDALVDALNTEAPDASVSGTISRFGGRISFLLGERDTIRTALLKSIPTTVAS